MIVWSTAPTALLIANIPAAGEGDLRLLDRDRGGSAWRCCGNVRIEMSRIPPSAPIPDRVRPHRTDQVAGDIDHREAQAGRCQQATEGSDGDGTGHLGSRDRRRADAAVQRQLALTHVGEAPRSPDDPGDLAPLHTAMVVAGQASRNGRCESVDKTFPCG